MIQLVAKTPNLLEFADIDPASHLYHHNSFREIAEAVIRKKKVSLSRLYSSDVVRRKLKDNDGLYRVALAAINTAPESIAGVIIDQNMSPIFSVSRFWHLVKVAVRESTEYQVFRYVSEQMSTVDFLLHENYANVALLAVSKDPSQLKLVPERFAMEYSEPYAEIALTAVRGDPSQLMYVPERFAMKYPQLYAEIALTAVKGDPDVTGHVLYCFCKTYPEKYQRIDSSAETERNKRMYAEERLMGA